MRNLKEYILEAGEAVGTLPFTEGDFINFMFSSFIDEEYDDSQYWQKLENIIVSKYGNNVWLGFKSWCEGYVYMGLEGRRKTNYTNDDFIRLYNDLKLTPLNRIKKVLGGGSYGIVFDIGNNKVLKYFYDPIRTDDMKFFKYCMNHKSNVFPNVYKIGNNYVIMEKLEMHTKKCNLISKYTDECEKIGGLYLEKSNVGKLKRLLNSNTLSKDESFVVEWFINICVEMGKIGLVDTGDLCSNNYGERKNGDIIYFDI